MTKIKVYHQYVVVKSVPIAWSCMEKNVRLYALTGDNYWKLVCQSPKRWYGTPLAMWGAGQMTL